jgi:hypothetical protein
MEKQVDKSHYSFQSYMTKERWNSVWHQVDEIVKMQPEKVLEIGPGSGVFKGICKLFGLNIETFDIDSELHPDYIGSATALPFADGTYDVICAFQMLEHLPYEESLKVFKEMVRCKSRFVVISLPDCEPMWRYKIHVPKFGSYDFNFNRRRSSPPVHEFDGQHYWEVNVAGHSLENIIADLSKMAKLIKTYRVIENPYHRFFIFS